MLIVHIIITIFVLFFQFFGPCFTFKEYSDDDLFKTNESNKNLKLNVKPLNDNLSSNQHYSSQSYVSSPLPISSLRKVSSQKTSLTSSKRSFKDSLTSLNQMRMFEEKAIPKNVTGQVGQPVYLHCIVEPIGEKTISWLRLKDFHLLTVGLVTYTHDSRFVIRHGTFHANDWSLEIKHVTSKDEGLYECQVNTDPPRSQYYYLRVVVPHAKMIGEPDDVVVKVGATINLSCVISRSPNQPMYVFWYQNDRMINYDYKSNGRGEVIITKDPRRTDTVISRLLIKNAKQSDAGNYTCAPSNTDSTSINVNVLQDEKRLSKNWPQNDEGVSTKYTSLSNKMFNLNTVWKIIYLLVFYIFNFQYTYRST